MSGVLARVAGAPISWGVCEVPGWGHQLGVDRVLSEMRGIGLRATEFGPDGFLPDDPAAKAAVLESHELAAVGGFLPLVLHDPDHDPLPGLDRVLDGFLGAGAQVVVLAAATGLTGYDRRPELDDADWKVLLNGLDRAAEHAASRGLRASLHPHVGTVVETGDEVTRVLEGSDVALCVDTGHLMVGGTDPAVLTRDVTDRVVHAHLKDVDATWVGKVRAGEVTYTDAVRGGMYRPLGQGDVDIAGIVATLEGAGYQGWYVVEQDTVLDGEPAGEGPVADVRASVTYLAGLG
ncbi:MAG: inosose dehydratase [Actinomycetota bacterium]|nr:inosose dehydratase [Actinomycetota bacterium]